MKTKKEKEENDRYFDLLCDLEDALNAEDNEEEMGLLTGEFAALLDEWEVLL